MSWEFEETDFRNKILIFEKRSSSTMHITGNLIQFVIVLNHKGK